MIQIKQPIFIIGAGRSGTSVFYNHLAAHPEVCWFSNYSDRYLRFSFVPLLHRLLELPAVGALLKSKMMDNRWVTLRPSEGGTIYHDYCRFEHRAKSDENDLTREQEEKLKGLIRNHLRKTGKKRFLNKQTANNQRLPVLDRLFPDALYVHIIRDGRAVANSLRHVDWWDDMDFWWSNDQDSPVVPAKMDRAELAGLHWMKSVKEIFDNKPRFEGRYIELRYEDLVQNFHQEMEKVIRFCGLTNSEEFFNELPVSLPDQNEKWKQQLTDSQKRSLENRIGPFLEQLGYD